MGPDEFIVINDKGPVYEKFISDSDSSATESEDYDFGDFTNVGLTRLMEVDDEHKRVKRHFENPAMEDFGIDLEIVAIHKNTFPGISGYGKLHTVNFYSNAIARRWGRDSNIICALHGASREEICILVRDGFRRCRRTEDGAIYGEGVYLYPVEDLIECLLSSAIDDDGLRHVVLCRAIMGNMKVLRGGSKQDIPSSRKYDSGVGSNFGLTRFIVWFSKMNISILHEYVITFRLPSHRGFGIIQGPAGGPFYPCMKYPSLRSMLFVFLPRSKRDQIKKYYSQYEDNKISSEVLMQKLREVAGVKLVGVLNKVFVSKEFEVATTRR